MDWADLPGDLLTTVGALLAVPGRICLRAVCRAWRAAIKEEEAAAMPSPWVIIPRTEGFSDSFTVLSAPTMNFFQWTPPGGVRARCVGSNGSWLAIVTAVDVKTVAMSLVNPLTDARVELPLITTPMYSPWLFDPDPSDVEWGMDSLVQKVAFSPSPTAQDYAAAYVSNATTKLLCARAGTDGWHLLAEIPSGDCMNFIKQDLDVAYHDGKFYYMVTSGQVWVADMTTPSPSPVPLAVLEPPLPTMVYLERGFHLAFSGDGALHVVWSLNDGHGCTMTHTCPDMLLTRYDPASGFFSPWTTPLTSIGGWAFFIGDRNQSMSVPVDGSTATWLRPDYVYFTNTPLSELYAFERRGLWAFDLVTGGIGWPRGENEILEKQLESELDVHWDKSLWLMPSFT
jgi:hypothetical protein